VVVMLVEKGGARLSDEPGSLSQGRLKTSIANPPSPQNMRRAHRRTIHLQQPQQTCTHPLPTQISCAAKLPNRKQVLPTEFDDAVAKNHRCRIDVYSSCQPPGAPMAQCLSMSPGPSHSRGRAAAGRYIKLPQFAVRLRTRSQDRPRCHLILEALASHSVRGGPGERVLSMVLCTSGAPKHPSSSRQPKLFMTHFED
jgi:hypothetical protein